MQAFDLTFRGYGGQPIKGWFLLPARQEGPLPYVVEYIGYGGGRGFPFDWLVWSSLGYAHLVMDTRGQGSAWRSGDTPDLAEDGDSPQYPGFMTRGHPEPKDVLLPSPDWRRVARSQSRPGASSGRSTPGWSRLAPARAAG